MKLSFYHRRGGWMILLLLSWLFFIGFYAAEHTRRLQAEAVIEDNILLTGGITK